MSIDKQKATAWARAVGEWVGDSPYKAATFGLAVFLVGLIVGLIV